MELHMHVDVGSQHVPMCMLVACRAWNVTSKLDLPLTPSNGVKLSDMYLCYAVLLEVHVTAALAASIGMGKQQCFFDKVHEINSLCAFAL